MSKEETIKNLKKLKSFHNGSYGTAIDLAIKALEQGPCEDCISRKSLRQKLQEHHDFFVNAYGNFRGMSLNDKIRVDEISNCIAMVVNEPSVTPQPKLGEWIKEHHTIKCNNCNTIIFTSCDYNDRQEYRDMVMDDYIEQYRYCPFCGRRMNGGGEDAK